MGTAHGDELAELLRAEKSSRTAASGGISFGYPLSAQFVFQPEVLFVSKGVVYADAPFNAKATFRTLLMEIPILIKFSPAVGSQIRPEMFGGLYVAFPLNAYVKSTGYFYPPNGETNIKDQLSSPEIGFVFGVGTSHKVSKAVITLEARFDYGLTNLMDKHIYSEQVTAKTSTFMFLAGIRFPLL